MRRREVFRQFAELVNYQMGHGVCQDLRHRGQKERSTIGHIAHLQKNFLNKTNLKRGTIRLLINNVTVNPPQQLKATKCDEKKKLWLSSLKLFQTISIKNGCHGRCE